MTHINSIAVVGAGAIGRPVTDEFLRLKKAGSLSRVAVITRASSAENEVNKELKAHGADIIPVDYDSRASLVSAFDGIDAVVVTVGGGAFHLQGQVVEAAKAAGVKLVVPSEYGVPTDNLKEDEFMGFKTKIQNKLRALDLPFAVFYTGLWSDFPFTIKVLGFDFENGKATVHGSGDAPLSFTARGDTARYMGHVLTKLPLNELEWKIFRIEGERLTWHQLAQAWEAKHGKKLAITHVPRAELEEKAKNPSDFRAGLLKLWDDGLGTVGSEAELSNKLYPDWKPTMVLDAVSLPMVLGPAGIPASMVAGRWQDSAVRPE